MSPAHVLIVEARFYAELADQLAAGTIEVLSRAGATFERVAVPGSFELPSAVRFAFETPELRRRFDGCVTLGCVIQGQTDHYEHICRETSRGLMDVALDLGIPLGFGVLTCKTYEQAAERCDIARRNKGADAAEACLSLIALKRMFCNPQV